MLRTAPESEPLAALLERFQADDWPLIAVSNQGKLVRVRTGAVDVAVKSPVGRGLLWQARRLSLQREYRAYRRLGGIHGIPRCFGLYGGCHLVVEYVEGALLRDAAPAAPETFFAQLKRTIDAMHERGVAHGDLKSRRNVMIAPDGNPVIIDLGTAVVRRDGWHPVNQRLFDYLRQIDLNGWIKLKYGSYDRASELDRHLLRRSMIERINHWARQRGL